MLVGLGSVGDWLGNENKGSVYHTVVKMFYFGKKGDETKGKKAIYIFIRPKSLLVREGHRFLRSQGPGCLLQQRQVGTWNSLRKRQSHLWAGATECLKSEGDISHLMRRSNVCEMILHGPETAKHREDVSHR